MAPNPSVDPSGDPSSSSVTAEDAAPVAAPSEKKTKTKSAQDIIKTRLADENVTDTEADQMAKNIDAAGDGRGGRIKSLPTWVTNRDINTLRGDLAQVRRFADAPPSDAVCSEHGLSLASGKCTSCEGDMNTGDFETVLKILERDGADARPDIARRTGAPQKPVGGLYERDPGAYFNSLKRRPSGVVGGSRGGVRDHAFYNAHTDEEIRAMFM